jgi:hypothetical protein
MKVEVPTSAQQIPLENYQEYAKLEEPTQIDMISTLLGYDTSVIKRFKAHSVDELTQAIGSIFNKEFNLVLRFKMFGTEYGFIPNLDDATYGEIDDIREAISDIQTWHKAMAVLYRPVTDRAGRKYKIEEYQPGKYDQIMKQIPLSYALGAQVFFWTLTADLLSCTPSAMREEVQANTLGSSKNGEDIIQQLHWLEMTGQELKKLVEGTFTPA